MKIHPRAAVAVAAVGTAVLTACAPAIQLQTAEVPQASQAVVTGPFLGAKEVDFRNELVLTSEQGRFTSVAVTAADGTEVPGTMADGGTEWHIAPRTLDLATPYTVTATAVDRYGTPVTSTSDFTTMTPANVVTYDFSVQDGATYGVGMPVSLVFNKPVSDRAAVERELTVTTSVPVEGSWSWENDQRVTYRPKDYWPSGTNVTVVANLKGVETAPDVFITDNGKVSYSIGSSLIAVANAATDQMTVTRDGQVIRTIPITTGKPGWETRSGIKVITSKQRHVIMDAGTLGVDKNNPDYYRLDVDYAMRLTYSGEFVHAAPWSVASQGVANVSHGCVGMSTSNAAWLYNQAKVGDIVQVTNTGRSQNLGNGITVWNESWEQWVAGSALQGASQ